MPDRLIPLPPRVPPALPAGFDWWLVTVTANYDVGDIPADTGLDKARRNLSRRIDRHSPRINEVSVQAHWWMDDGPPMDRFVVAAVITARSEREARAALQAALDAAVAGAQGGDE